MAKHGNRTWDECRLSTSIEQVKEADKDFLCQLGLLASGVVWADVVYIPPDGCPEWSQGSGELIYDVGSCSTVKTVCDCISEANVSYYGVSNYQWSWWMRQGTVRGLRQCWGGIILSVLSLDRLVGLDVMVAFHPWSKGPQKWEAFCLVPCKCGEPHDNVIFLFKLGLQTGDAFLQIWHHKGARFTLNHHTRS